MHYQQALPPYLYLGTNHEAAICELKHSCNALLHARVGKVGTCDNAHMQSTVGCSSNHVST